MPTSTVPGHMRRHDTRLLRVLSWFPAIRVADLSKLGSCRGMTTELTSYVTPAGADWLASASDFPRSVRALWSARPAAPSVLPCGTAFDVISAPALFGRKLLDRLWAGGPGSGPVALQRDRVLLFAEPGSGQRLRALLDWEEWAGRQQRVPPLLCHGLGDAVTVPPVRAPHQGEQQQGETSRWLVAPADRHPWLPGSEVLLWSALRAVRPRRAAEQARQQHRSDHRQSIFVPQDAGAKVYDVSRRR